VRIQPKYSATDPFSCDRRIKIKMEQTNKSTADQNNGTKQWGLNINITLNYLEMIEMSRQPNKFVILGLNSAVSLT